MADIYERIVMSASEGNAISTVEKVAASLGRGGLLGALTSVTLAGGALAVGLGIVSVKMAGDFQQSMLSLVAHAGLAKDQFDKVSQAVLAMAPAVGRSPQQLAEALYPILSAFSGIQNQSAKSAIALDTLKMSFQAVAGTTVNGADVANAAVGTFNALGLATNNVSTNTARMKNLFDVMDLTVQRGNMQWDAYKNVISKLAVSIQGTGVQFNEASAALATLTNEGYSAQRAQTYLSNMFTTMAIKTDALAKHAKALKISFDEQKYSSMSLADKIAYLNQVTDGNKQKLLALLGGNSTALKSFNALSVGISGYGANLTALNHAQGALASSFDTAKQGLNFQLSQGLAALQALGVEVGTVFLPVVTQAVAYVVPLIQQFTAWLAASHILEIGLASLSTGVTNTVGFLLQMVAVGVSVVQFFQANQSAAAALGVAVGALGGVLALFAASSVADMILSLLEYGLSLLTAAAETVTAATVMTSTFSVMSGMIIASMGAAATSILATLGPFLLVGAAVAAISIGIVLAVMHWSDLASWFASAWAEAGRLFTGTMDGLNYALHATMQWFIDWQQPIIAVTTLITMFFLPALIQAGVQAAISGGAVAGPFVASMVLTGLTATNTGLVLAATFIASMIDSGAVAVASGAKITYSFVAGMIAAGWQASVNGAKITYNFIASLIAAGIAGWVAAGGLVPFIGGLIASGYQSVIAAFAMRATLIPSLYAVGVAAYAALGPIGLVLGAIALAVTAFALMKQKSDEMQLGVSGAFDTMGNKVQRSSGRVMVWADQMKTSVSQSTQTMNVNVSRTADQMRQDVSKSVTDMRTIVVDDSTTMSNTASKLWDKFKNNATASLQQLDSSTISYMNEIAAYIDNASATAAQIANENFAKIHVPSMSASNVTHNFNDSSNTPGHAAGILNNPAGHWAMVGERGPEPMWVPKGASILPNSVLGGGGSRSSDRSGSGNVYVTINNPVVDSQQRLQQMADKVGEALARQFLSQAPGYATGGYR